ncbi:MAG TPA: hypothetical protein VH327_02165 [Gammaproteobacteria bacterium]|nr:hypothetical protein [Gammaproteobacteria bacterium]
MKNTLKLPGRTALTTGVATARALQARFAGRLARAVPYLVALAAVAAVLLFGDKFWATNDDGHMAMIAHGYGMTDTPSPGIAYSNVIWGWMVMHLGVAGIQGYSVGAYAAMVLSCLMLCLALYRSTAPAWAGAALIVMMFAPALMNMQFTITAGYLAVAGIALLLTARREDGPWLWPAVAVLLLLSALIRLDECAFVVLLAVPFCAVRWQGETDRQLRRRAAAALAITLLAIGASSVANRAYYSGERWDTFREMNALRRPFSDYDLTQYYSANREQLAGSGVSVNDLRVIDQRAFLDTGFFTPARLQPLIDKVTADQRVDFNLHRWPEALRPFGQLSTCAPLLLLLLAIIGGRGLRAPVLASLLFVGVALFFWVWGRPGIVHIYMPAEAALGAFALIGVGWRFRLLLPVAGAALFLFALMTTWRIANATYRESVHAVEHVQTACTLPKDELLVVWGVPALNERQLYRPMSPSGRECDLQLYFINTLSLLPGTLDKLYGYTHGKSLIEALRDGQQFKLLSDEGRIGLLTIYFETHFGAKLTATPLALGGSNRAYLLRVTP